MSVYPDDSRPVPEGALTPSTVKDLQSVTEASARAEIRSQALVPWREGRDNFFTNIIGGIGKAFQDGLAGIVGGLGDLFSPVRKAAQEVRDGQLALDGRVDLVDPLLNYGSVYVPQPSGLKQKNSWHRIPFTAKISTTMRGCSVLPAGGIRLDRPGLWDIRTHLVTGNAVGLLPREVTLDLRIVRPDGSTFSSLVGRTSSKSPDSITVISSVQVPDPGYEVQAWIYVHNYEANWGSGPAYSRLTVQQINSDSEASGDQDSEAPGEVGGNNGG